MSPARPGAALRGHMLPLESAAAETGPWGDRGLVEGAPCASRGSHPLLAGSLRLARGRPAAPERRPLERRRGRPQECECASKGPTGAGRPARSPAHQGVVTAACRACSRCISGAVAVRPQVARTTAARTTALCGFGQRRETRPSVLSGFVRLRRGRDETRWRVCRSLHVPVVREPAPSPVWKRQISEKWCSLIKPNGL